MYVAKYWDNLTLEVKGKSKSVTAFYQYAHFIPIVGVGKERRTLIRPC